MKELKRMAKESEDAPDHDDDGDNSEDECDRIQTIEESSMPLEEILTRFYRQGYIIGRNPTKNKFSLEVCLYGCGYALFHFILMHSPRTTMKIKRVVTVRARKASVRANHLRKSPPSERKPREMVSSVAGMKPVAERIRCCDVSKSSRELNNCGLGSLLSKLITDGEEGDGDKPNTETNASESTDSVAPVREALSESTIVCNSNNTSKTEPAEEKEKKEEETNATPMIKTKQKKTPINAEKKAGAADDGVIEFRDDEDSEDDSDFNEAEEEAEDEECEDEDECDSDDDGEDVAIPGGLETPGEDSGTTACVCLMNKDRIVVANSGDSRAVLCRDGTAIDLSLDHKPEDDIERTRIVNAGGFVNEDGRVNGGLNLSRAFGDHSYKKNTDLPLRDQMITALPDVKVETLQPNDEFLVVACDGIWNSLNSQQVVDFIRERLKQGKSCVDISEELCDHCLAPSTAGDGTGCDNMTVIIATITH
ncbi:protein phosphatase 2C [Ancylostoma caninum]|uniref:protein-serine/threonine phosphatase n=1 Tax=Ancylostoma caninum TaxID=29170 RepID=A0A368G7N7_ANCCA|nr:protein phosphatase 2C [Ancylostoma caninum]